MNRIISFIESAGGCIGMDLFIGLLIQDYYSKNLIGKDFITSSETGTTLSISISEWIKKNINKSSFDLTETGPGSGNLICSILDHLLQSFNADIIENIYLVENSSLMIETQKRNIYKRHAEILSKFIWIDDLYKLEDKIKTKSNLVKDICNEKKQIFINNEFFDAIPIKQFIVEDNKVYEIVVTTKNRKLFFGKINCNELNIIDIKKYAECHGHFKNGDIIEISPTRNMFINEICKLIQEFNGCALNIDYGYYHAKKNCTIKLIKNHKILENHIENFFEADISSDVDFKMIDLISKKYSKVESKIHSQESFILNNITNKDQTDFEYIISDLSKNFLVSELIVK